METNILPRYDTSENPTNCCPRFKPEGWDEQDLHFEDKLFVKATTRSLFHIPLNMGTVYPQTSDAIEAADAMVKAANVVLLNKRDKETNRIRSTVKVRIDFVLRANQVTPAGEKQIARRVDSAANREMDRPMSGRGKRYTTVTVLP